MRSLLCILTLVSAAACRTVTSPIGFQAFRVRSVTPDFGHRKIALHVALDFRVRNPLTIPLVVPQHDYTVQLGGGAGAVTQHGVQAQTTVAAGEVKVVSYDVDIEVSGPRLAALAGRDAPYAFSAEVDVVKAAQGETAALAPGFQSIEDQIKAALPANLQPGKLVLAHEGTLRLPLLPAVRWGGRLPSIALKLRPLPPIDIGSALTAAREGLQPAMTALTAALDAQPPPVSITLGGVLDKLGVTGNKRKAVLKAFDAAGMSERSAIDVAVGKPTDLVPALGQAWSSLSTAWTRFPPDDLQRFTPAGSLPSGITLHLPFRVENPNHFAIQVPELDFTVAPPGESPVVKVQVSSAAVLAAPAPVADCTTTPPPTSGGTTIPCGGAAEMELVGDLSWQQVELLPSLVRQPLAVEGHVTLDLGYGPITLPVALDPIAF